MTTLTEDRTEAAAGGSGTLGAGGAAPTVLAGRSPEEVPSAFHPTHPMPMENSLTIGTKTVGQQTDD